MLASNGLHTNGYTLVRLLMEKMPQIKLDRIEGKTFIEQIMKPHTPYYPAVKCFGEAASMEWRTLPGEVSRETCAGSSRMD